MTVAVNVIAVIVDGMVVAVIVMAAHGYCNDRCGECHRRYRGWDGRCRHCNGRSRLL